MPDKKPPQQKLYQPAQKYDFENLPKNTKHNFDHDVFLAADLQ